MRARFPCDSSMLLSAAHVISHLKKKPASPALVVVVVGVIGGLELAGGVRGLTGKKDYKRDLRDTPGRDPILFLYALAWSNKEFQIQITS